METKLLELSEALPPVPEFLCREPKAGTDAVRKDPGSKTWAVDARLGGA
jgi:hypothetical protein